MGLMLSVLVFFVGVVEVLDCWHNFLLHLIQPEHKSTTYQFESKTKLQHSRELNTPVEFRRPSNIDICWPKDLSPTDDLHVIKKRAHFETERSFEHDDDSTRRHSKGKIPHNEVDSVDVSGNSPSLDVPQIVVHRSEVYNPVHQEQESPICSRESSPNYLELSVIVESDSSSEFDEPSQIENPEYKMRKEADLSSVTFKLHEELVENSQQINVNLESELKVPLLLRPENDSICRPASPVPLCRDSLSENNTDSEVLGNLSYSNSVDPSVRLEDLPIFTDTIISNNIMKVSGRYPSDIVELAISSLTDVERPSSEVISYSEYDNAVGQSESNKSQNEQVKLTPKNLDEIIPQEQPLHPDDGKEQRQIVECPEITFRESSPVPDVEDSDSSLNTSDASWMIKSKTSDRPLKIRFSPPPEKIMKAGGNGYPIIGNVIYSYGQAPLDLQIEVAEFVDDIIEEALEYLSRETFDDVLNGCDKTGGCIAQSKRFCETNSSSSSLSGIPQLPEDLKDTVYLNLPTHNGMVTRSLKEDSFETSYSIYDNVQSSALTDDNEDKVDLVRTRSFDHIARETGCTDVFDKSVLPHSKSVPLMNLPKMTENKDQVEECMRADGSILSHAKPTDSNNVFVEDSNSPLLVDSSQENNLLRDNKTSETKKFFNKLEAEKPSSKSLKTKSSENKESVLLCRAKESKEAACDKSSSLISVGPLPGPGPSTCTPAEDSPSTSGAGKPEDKAFWLIFSGEYTKAMNKDWHSGHFCCWQCDESLTGQRYVLRDEHPYCIKCYESVFANGCEECSKTIGIDSKDLSYKDKHWHEACFLCNKCRVSLVDKQFGSKLDKIFCGNCYDAQFASRCDGCGQIFKAGTKKMEYKTRQWHEPCFACCVCKSAIGTKSFIPREQEIYCATCYEEKFATRCVKCNKIITSGGVTYKNEPWHRECFTCTNCNTSLAGQRFTSKEEKPYCADCFGELFAKRCTACCKPITGIGGTRFVSFEDRHWHNDCFSCASCKTSLVGRGFITDGDDIICPECAKQKLM